MVNESTDELEFSPSFEELVFEIDGLIEHIVESCEGIKRAEDHLFQPQEDVEINNISVMQASEEPVEEAKIGIEKVIRRNTAGPEK